MAKKLYGHAMLTFGKDVIVIGGIDESYNYQSSLYLMTCDNQDCEWLTATKEIKISRMSFVVMLIPDELTDCGKYAKFYYFLKHACAHTITGKFGVEKVSKIETGNLLPIHLSKQNDGFDFWQQFF